MAKFNGPNVIYVTRDDEGNLLVWEDIEDIAVVGARIDVGIYSLDETGVVTGQASYAEDPDEVALKRRTK